MKTIKSAKQPLTLLQCWQAPESGFALRRRKRTSGLSILIQDRGLYVWYRVSRVTFRIPNGLHS